MGGIGVEGWLQQLERAQRAQGPARTKMPPLSDRTVSMPTLNDGTPFRNYRGQALPPGWDRPPHKPISQEETPQGSVEDLFLPPGQWKTARFRSSPRPEPVRVSTLASVRNGWLPIQKRAVVCDITRHAPPPKDSTSQDQYNPSNATSIPKCFMKKNGLECTDGKERDTSTQANCLDPRPRRLSGQASPNIIQTSNLASLESDSPLGWERWKKGWEERRTAFFSAGVQPGDHNAVPQRHSPLHRTASAPVPSCTAAPPAGLETLPTKPRFSSIMATARRIPRSHTSPLSSGGTTESDEAGSSAPPAHENPPANHPSEPIVRRRRVSVIKVTDTGRSRHSDETAPGVGPREFRHSYSEGDGKENVLSRFCLQGGTGPARPSACTEGRRGSADAALHPRRPRSCSLAEPEGSGEKIYRSTLSLYLCRPSSGGEAAGDLGRPARPPSFAGAFRHADPGLGGPPDPAAKPPSFGSPEKANIGCARDAACSLNLSPPSVSYHGAESSKQDVGSRRGPGLHPGQSWSQRPAAVRPQAFSPTMNSEDHGIDVGLKDLSSFGTHQSAEAILALNAASIIASIKLQTRINKMANLLSEQESKKPPEPGNETVENSGSHESSPPAGGVVRRLQGNAGRKARPHPIYWQEPPSDQQEDNAAPLTLREALELLRPDFIKRSQRRLKEVELRAQKRRAQQGSTLELESAQAARRTCSTKPNPLGDDHCKLGDRAIAGKEIVLRSKSSAPNIKRNRQEEKKKVASQTNRLRAAVFKKKLLDQILRRNMD
ncbi:(E2-independent) E3 ubiquitin-conjugating enzyme FATS isoform X2 [Anguilla anguilla]|uniref:(E2-independent) E3 ubiquitin-conjugating enzyme FATS isoform X2 n=1 Tax=Anguilla anguilla TaxID=7936 RepID=UPI0015AB305E|nr:(E2-independent) E3 ubiquitin-conjugating enzyme FATS isoform X2 [Anguilla anguilla]